VRTGKIFVAGHRGMLGHTVTSYFRARGVRIETLDLRYSPAHPWNFFATLDALRPEVVINALGLIKQREGDPEGLRAINGEFPLLLRLVMPRDALLVHASSDCVFRGDRGGYKVSDPLDAVDPYGVSKGLGERVAEWPNTLVVRTSIVGLEPPETTRGLLAWFLSHRDGERVPGFVDHTWNGLTTIEWCGFVESEIHAWESGRAGKIVQPCCDVPLTKFEMLKVFNATFQRRIQVDPVHSDGALDRSLIPTITLGRSLWGLFATR
jgi:dTDP-4-dehydrorhamnose reductase